MARSRYSLLACVAACACAALLAACASSVPVAPVALAPLAQAAPELVLAQDLPVKLPTAYVRTIPGQSRWRAVGSVPAGVVYQPLDTVFAIEGRHVHEAWLVVRGEALQGFYLPAEGNYSALDRPLSLPLERGARR